MLVPAGKWTGAIILSGTGILKFVVVMIEGINARYLGTAPQSVYYHQVSGDFQRFLLAHQVVSATLFLYPLHQGRNTLFNILTF
ncbi:hypothetical protein P886_1683 [Alteromonadaceae bacterium 2753L.S.0a.02]|nr:hypothetical protein P886_1683 [Alteromonadaceae bacterium 2753L.S.0a.02]